MALGQHGAQRGTILFSGGQEPAQFSLGNDRLIEATPGILERGPQLDHQRRSLVPWGLQVGWRRRWSGFRDRSGPVSVRSPEDKSPTTDPDTRQRAPADSLPHGLDRNA